MREVGVFERAMGRVHPRREPERLEPPLGPPETYHLARLDFSDKVGLDGGQGAALGGGDIGARFLVDPDAERPVAPRVPYRKDLSLLVHDGEGIGPDDLLREALEGPEPVVLLLERLEEPLAHYLGVCRAVGGCA